MHKVIEMLPQCCTPFLKSVLKFKISDYQFKLSKISGAPNSLSLHSEVPIRQGHGRVYRSDGGLRKEEEEGKGVRMMRNKIKRGSIGENLEKNRPEDIHRSYPCVEKEIRRFSVPQKNS